MGIPSAYSRKAISGNDIKNDSSTLLNAGNVSASLANNVTLSENTDGVGYYGSNIVQSVSPTSSGNVGIGLAISNGTINKNTDGNYIAIMLGTKIAGITTTLLRTPGSDLNQRPDNKFQGYRRYGVNTWNSNHIITKGSDAGAAVLPSGIDGRVGAGADDAVKYPGEFASMQGGPNPVQDDYNT